MLSKFETKSNRVKGLSFHPNRPWILASLHNGIVQLWNYRMMTLLDRFDEHDGPVRGIHFHDTEPLFVSGGDDYKIKVWNYKLRRCLFTLLGHLDYIRTVYFHHENPWIVSASDDQTIRIWNWQSRTCIAVLTGHNHYVMCANFHPTDDLVVSASLDQTVRVWDTSGLRKKNLEGGGRSEAENVVARVNSDLFGGSDAVVKYVLEGHDRGVNWASFHPTLPLIISGADDRQVKLWRMNETKAWEMDTMRGHTNNVSCVLFHPRHDLVISNSEDRSIRVWDVSKRMGVQTFRREHDRFWIVAAHPTSNLLAAGHDTGMIVFKLQRERPPFDIFRNKMFYVKDRYLRSYEFRSNRDVPIVSLARRSGHAYTAGVGSQGPHSVMYNQLNAADSNILVYLDEDGGSYELHSFSQDAGERGDAESGEAQRGPCMSCCFVARNKFATLDRSGKIHIKNYGNTSTKKLTSPLPNPTGIFFAGTAGRVLIRNEEKVMLYEHGSRRQINSIYFQRAKRVVWNRDFSFVAIMSKGSIVLATRNLEQLCTVTETVRIKSGAWDDRGVFIYTTLNHIKYVLPHSGDQGIVRSLDEVLYLTRVAGNVVHCLDREAQRRKVELDPTEYLFKLALFKKRYSDVMKMIKRSALPGQSIIAYLQRKGFPQVALHFVQDDKMRFNLAIECGYLEGAMETAMKLGDDECWQILGREALRQGIHQMVEMAYQKTKDFERLSFLYLITGNTAKLRKMLKISEMRKDVMSSFHNALYLADVPERIKIFEQVGQLSLAYMTAATHGLTEDAERLEAELEAVGMSKPELLANPKLLVPPTPILRGDNWPLLTVSQGYFEGALKGGVPDDEATSANLGADDDLDLDAAGGGWGDDDDLDLDGDGGGRESPLDLDDDGEGGGWGGDDDDLDLDFGEEDASAAGAAADDAAMADALAVPSEGKAIPSLWMSNSNIAADHCAAGDFTSAMQLLHRQIGVTNFEPLRQSFMATYTGAMALAPGMPSMPSMDSYLQRNAQESAPGSATLPAVSFTLASLVDYLKAGYRYFHKGKFDDARNSFDSIVRAIPLVVVDTRSEEQEVKQLLDICREYITALRLQEARKAGKASGEEPKRLCELAAYFTSCKLQPAHLALALDVAMSSAYRLQNFITSAGFARRLIDMPQTGNSKSMRAKAQKVLSASERKGRNAHELDYDERNPFVMCGRTLTPIFKGSAFARCPYCGTAFKPEFKTELCDTCGLAVIGVKTLGLVCYNPSRR